MPEDFSKNLIKEYRHWKIYINANQSYLGRCVVWCKRADALDLADAAPEEQQELFLVLHDLREASRKVFQADWFNYLFLGNAVPHLHGHFLPRYKKPKKFMGITFSDKLFGQYPDDSDNNQLMVPEEVLWSIKDMLAEALK